MNSATDKHYQTGLHGQPVFFCANCPKWFVNITYCLKQGRVTADRNLILQDMSLNWLWPNIRFILGKMARNFWFNIMHISTAWFVLLLKMLLLYFGH